MEELGSASDRVTFTVGPHAPYTVSDETFERVKVGSCPAMCCRRPRPCLARAACVFCSFSLTPWASVAWLGVCGCAGEQKISEEHNLKVHLHLHETAPECADSVAGTESMTCHRSSQRCRPFEVRLGGFASPLPGHVVS